MSKYIIPEKAVGFGLIVMFGLATVTYFSWDGHSAANLLCHCLRNLWIVNISTLVDYFGLPILIIDIVNANK